MSAAARPPRAEGAPVGPGSLLWAIAGDPRGLLPGSAAGLMQLMLPGLGAGVTDHSNFFDDPYDRIFRSIPYIWGGIFAPDDEEGAARGRAIRDFHPEIKGTDHHGQRYHALDPEVFWWAHATFTWEFFRARELFWACPLGRAAQRQLYAETVTWYRRYGVSDRVVPATLEAFRRRFDQLCRTELEMTPAVTWVFEEFDDPGADPQAVQLPGPLAPLAPLAARLGANVQRLLVYGAMPDVVRRRFGLAWAHADRAGFAAICAAIRGLDPLIRRGALDAFFPEGTPHPDRTDPTRVVVAGPSDRQANHRRAGAGA